MDKDQVTDKDSFIDKELKFARRWLYTKGVMVSEEVELSLSFEGVHKLAAAPAPDATR